MSDMEPRQAERWRVAIVEAIGAHLSYPPFFDYRAGREVVRPLDRAKRDEIQQFVRSANFSPIEASDVSSPDVRRFLERLLLRYLDVNPLLQGGAAKRRATALRARVPRVAGDVHRLLLGNVPPSVDRAPTSWRPAQRGGRHGEAVERNTKVLEAVLARSELGEATPSAEAGRGGSPAPVGAAVREARPAPASWARPTDATIPVLAQGTASGGTSPFAGFGGGAQSGMFGGDQPLSDSPTGPLPAMGALGRGPAPSLPEDLYLLYGDYLRDMHPEDDATTVHPVAPFSPPAVPAALPPLPTPAARPEGDGRAAPANVRAIRPPAAPAGPDVQIFYQLRHQLEAYVRRAVRGYGVRARADDAFSHLDALRRSGFVDESDLRLAEGILAVTDKVIETGSATVEDFRQAMMLYLLYHRSHLGS